MKLDVYSTSQVSLSGTYSFLCVTVQFFLILFGMFETSYTTCMALPMEHGIGATRIPLKPSVHIL